MSFGGSFGKESGGKTLIASWDFTDNIYPEVSINAEEFARYDVLQFKGSISLQLTQSQYSMAVIVSASGTVSAPIAKISLTPDYDGRTQRTLPINANFVAVYSNFYSTGASSHMQGIGRMMPDQQFSSNTGSVDWKLLGATTDDPIYIQFRVDGFSSAYATLVGHVEMSGIVF